MDQGEGQCGGISRRDLLIAAALGVLTLSLRFIYLFHSPDLAWPHSIVYEGDATVWVRWAVLLGNGTPFEDDLPFRTPGVAWLLYWMGMSAAPFTTAKMMWCMFSAATPAALYLVLTRWFSRRAGLIAAVLCALSYGSFVLANSLNNEAPYALILVVLVGFSLAWVDRPTWTLSITLGVLHGAALLLRAEHSLLLAMFLIYAAFRAWRESAPPRRIVGGSAAVLATSLAVCAPWSIRSHIATHEVNNAKTFRKVGPPGGPRPPDPYAVAQPPWTPAAIAAIESLPAFARKSNFAYLSSIAKRNGAIMVDEPDVRAFFDREWGYTPEPLEEWTLVSLKGPLDFALANHPEANGGFSLAGLRDSHDADAKFSIARPSHLRLMNHGYAIGWGYIRGDFSRWLTLVREKLSRFQDGATLGLFANDWPHAGRRVRHAVDLSTPVRGDAPVWNISVIVSLLVGAVVACRLRGGFIWLLIVAYKLAITVAFYGYARQAVSIAPALFALSGFCIGAMWCGRVGMSPRRSGVGSDPNESAAWSQTSPVKWIAGSAITLLFVVAAIQSWHPPKFLPRVTQSNGRMTDAPQWGARAFESFDDLALEPDLK